MKMSSRGNSKSKPKHVRAEVMFAAILAVALLSFLLSINIVSSTDKDKPLTMNGSLKNSLNLVHAEKINRIVLERKEKPRYFTVFSTSCSPQQNWQSLLFFYVAYKVKQPGNITRIVSGCNPNEADALRKIHREKISTLSDRFHLHVTPDWGFRDQKKYWNKPHGLLHWMKNELRPPNNVDEYDDDIIIILDPDMLLLKPITNDFGDFHKDDFWIGGKRIEKVRHSTPFAQHYGFGNAWLTSLKGNLSYVVGKNSPALKVTLTEASNYYPAGPPYLATGKDMFALAESWVKFLPRVHELYPQFMAEMHAYCIAAAHLEMPHQLAKGFMVSSVTGANKEKSFMFLDDVTREKACNAKVSPNKLPFVLHYCQRYAIGRWFFSKYKLHENIFDCDAELVREPPSNVAQMYDWYIFPNGIEKNDYSKPESQHFLVKHAWMMCTIIFSLNEAVFQMKKKHCSPKANYNKSFHFHNDDEFQDMLRNVTRPF